ncbi:MULTISPECIES: xanthine dehydrogenase family protein subunit M [unclassified Variovorax]|uniref:FAD binding domain-containing protein n=1 Tax=unclassified Variovorax TaxID=663243 RepID=UPI001BD61B33|nr:MULTISPECIES: xanthine dehydrogenase family protein subunit M [unclassified Variovorax]
MHDFDFLQPASVTEASHMLADLGDQARVMAGGTALMLALRQRMVSPTHVVSVANIRSMRGLTFDPGRGLRIGALVKHSEVARSELVRVHYPVLAAMAAQVANPQVRNQGTLGGNLCYADPSTDPPGCLLAHGAQVVVASTRGERVLSIDEFLVDFYATALAPDELVIEIRVPLLSADASGQYTRFLRTAAEHRPLASVALMTRRNGRHCHEARIVVGASVSVPRRLTRAEAFLAGKTVTTQVAADAADIVAAEISAISDARGSEEFRRDMVRVISRRTIADVFGLATA